MSKKLDNVIKELQQYITDNLTNLKKHQIIAKNNKCKWEVEVTEQRFADLFTLRYRLEQLLSEIKRNDLCKLLCYQATKEEKKKLVEEESPKRIRIEDEII